MVQLPQAIHRQLKVSQRYFPLTNVTVLSTICTRLTDQIGQWEHTLHRIDNLPFSFIFVLF